MKTHRLLLSALMALPGLLTAQTVTSGVPDFISYQGRVLDSAGAPVGTGTPVNRKVIFRVWDHPSSVLAANLIYSEEQTVTIADGKFSVLVGQGIGTTVEQFSFNETEYGPNANPSKSIANAFNGSGRYLGVTVDDGTVAVDNEIAPRQQVVTSAFAFRSKFAETLGSGATGGNSLTQITGGSFAVSGANTTTTTVNPQFLITADDITERLRIGVDSTGNGTSFLQSWKEGTGAGIPTNLLLNPNGGNVGIGTTAPQGALDVEGYVRIQTGAVNKGLLCFGNRGGSPEYYDHGIYRGGLGNLGPGNYLNLGSYAGIAFNTSAAALGAQPTRMFIDGGSGNVSIGTTAPLYPAKLFVHNANAPTDSAIFYSPGAGPTASHIHNGPNGDVYWRSAKPAGKVILQDTGGNVGIGTSAPGYKLQVQGSLYSQSLDTGTANMGTANMGPSRILGTGRNTGQGGLYLEWGNQSPGSYGQSFILNNQEAGLPGIFLGEVNNAHAISWSLFTQPGATHMNGHVYGWSFVAASDERIKSVVARSSSEADLDIVRKLRVTDYHFIDQKRGTGLQKGFIAQEVKTVVPEAVKSTGKSFIPSVYAEAKKLTFDADSKTLSITMAKVHDLKVGDFVEMTADGSRHEWKVSGVKDAKTFAVGPVKEVPARLFVYGKQVPDLLAVDYDRLFVSGIGAIQELVKQVDAVKLENAELKAKLAASEKRLSELSATDQAFEAKLIALEKRLQGSDKPAVRAVSLQGE
jgi:hypothetical protein